MKRIVTIVLIAVFSISISAQELDSLKAIMEKNDEPGTKQTGEKESSYPVIVEDSGEEVNVKVMDKEIFKVTESGDSTYVRIGEKGMLQVIDQPDSTTIRVGDKEIRIVEKNDDTAIRIQDIDDDDNFVTKRFRGHWAGFEWGINNFLDNANTLSRETDAWFMDLNTGRSWAININFAQYSLGFGTSHVGLLTGLGLEFSNYFFDNDNTIHELNDFIIADSLDGNVSKSKLTTTFLRVPLILEVQFPNTIRAKRVFLSAGIVAGLKLGSHTKVVYKDDGGKNKDKNRDDFNINPFRYGLTARLGFGNVSLFGDYYFTPLFVDEKGPELHPFSVGLSFNF
jgi:Outer membrane protein beta-barrel domain